MKPNSSKKLISLAEGAENASVSISSARRLVATDWKSFSAKVKGRIKLDKDALNDWITSQFEGSPESEKAAAA